MQNSIQLTVSNLSTSLDTLVGNLNENLFKHPRQTFGDEQCKLLFRKLSISI